MADTQLACRDNGSWIVDRDPGVGPTNAIRTMSDLQDGRPAELFPLPDVAVTGTSQREGGRDCGLLSTGPIPPPKSPRVRFYIPPKPGRSDAEVPEGNTTKSKGDEPRARVHGFCNQAPKVSAPTAQNFTFPLDFPPGLPKDIQLSRQAEQAGFHVKYPAIEIQEIVAEHTRNCRDYGEYVKQYIVRRDELVAKANALSSELSQAEKQLTILRAREKNTARQIAARSRANAIRVELDGIAAELVGMKTKAELVIQNDFDLSYATDQPKKMLRAASTVFSSQQQPREHKDDRLLPSGFLKPTGYQSTNIQALFDQPHEERRGPPLTGNFTAKCVQLSKNGRRLIKYDDAELRLTTAAQKLDQPVSEEPRPKFIPEWFSMLDSMEVIPLRAVTEEKRLEELLSKIWLFENETRLARSTTLPRASPEVFGRVVDNHAKTARPENVPAKKPWNKNHHNADPDWPTEAARQRGGWWLCRSDPAVATAPELACRQCKQGNNAGPSSHANPPRRPPKGLKAADRPGLGETGADCDNILEHINRCMAIVGVRDRAGALAQLRSERVDAHAMMSSDNWRSRADFPTRKRP